MNKLQETLLNIAIEFKKVCEEYNLCYYMISGTLLGAVRHKGFIPWDDDMDFCMPRRDYRKLINLYKKNPNIFPNHINLRFLDYTTCFVRDDVALIDSPPPPDSIEILESNLDSKDLRNMDNASFYSPCIRLENANTTLITKEDSINAGFSSDNRCVSFRTCGVNVDIFVMESYGNDLESARKNIQYMNKFFTYYIRRLMYPGITPNLKNRRFATKILKKIQYFFTYGNNPISNFFINLNKKKADTYLESKYKNITDLQSFVFCAWIDVFFNTKDLQEFIKLSFEGVEFFAPKNYDSILRSNYGDYMQLPPKEKQVAPHGFYYLNLESPYKNCKYNKLITSFVW